MRLIVTESVVHNPAPNVHFPNGRRMSKVRREIIGQAEIDVVEDEDGNPMSIMGPCPYFDDVIPKGAKHPYFERHEDAVAFMASLSLST